MWGPIGVDPTRIEQGPTGKPLQQNRDVASAVDAGIVTTDIPCTFGAGAELGSLASIPTPPAQQGRGTTNDRRKLDNLFQHPPIHVAPLRALWFLFHGNWGIVKSSQDAQ